MPVAGSGRFREKLNSDPGFPAVARSDTGNGGRRPVAAESLDERAGNCTLTPVFRGEIAL